MTEFVVVRHAQASLFAENYDQLSPLGERQARALGQAWRLRPPTRPGLELAFTGPARRHRHTAQLVLEQLTAPDAPTVLEGFDEHDGATLTRRAALELVSDPAIAAHLARIAALPAAELAQRARAYHRLYAEVMSRWLTGKYCPEEIEPWPRFEARVLDAFDALRRAAGDARAVVLFTSVGPTAVLLRRALDLSPERAYELAYRQRNASVSRFLYTADRLGLDAFNELHHLEDPAEHTFR